MSAEAPAIVIVGSGPAGATYARELLERLPTATVLMFELGPQLTGRPGVNVRNITNPVERARARRQSQGPQSFGIEGASQATVGQAVEGTFTARQGTHLMDFGGVGSGHSDGFGAAAMATNVGGQGAHWTCATPRPAFSERIPFIDSHIWDPALDRAEELLHTNKSAFSGSGIGAAIRSILQEEFAELPDGYRPGFLPVAGDENPDGTMTWAGTDFVLGPLIDPNSELARRFELRPLTLVREVLHESGHSTGVIAEDAVTGTRQRIDADVVILAADALRTPQLMWASGIRPRALGHFLTDHITVISTVALGESMARYATDEDLAKERATRALNPADPISAVNRVPFSEPAHPFGSQIMYLDSTPFAINVGATMAENHWGYANVGWGLRKWPRFQDAVSFDDGELDYRGFPTMTIRYRLTDREDLEIERAMVFLHRAASALGEFMPGAEPRVLPSGSSLHYMGTVRMGEVDDGTSVCDQNSRVWGFDNLLVAGNGVIPTANAANPTLTNVAICVLGAASLADRLVTQSTVPLTMPPSD